MNETKNENTTTTDSQHESSTPMTIEQYSCIGTMAIHISHTMAYARIPFELIFFFSRAIIEIILRSMNVGGHMRLSKNI